MQYVDRDVFVATNKTIQINIITNFDGDSFCTVLFVCERARACVRACVRTCVPVCVYAYIRRSPIEPSIPGREPKTDTLLLPLEYCTYGPLDCHLAIVF